MVEFKVRLKELRKEENVTQQFIADMLNVNRNAISRYETWSRQPSLEMLVKLANIYNVTIDYLLGVSDKRGY